MNDLKLFVRLAKIDEAQRIVYGTAIDETADRVKEVFDYSTSKPLFEKWSSDFEKVTDGKSLGNVRSMHGNTAAGKLTQITFDDDGKKIDVAAKIVDDNEWNKVVEGVYTGFSIGGKYVKKWKDGDNHRYTAHPSEVSLVDLPCVPSATFAMVKADGTTVTKAFKPAEAAEEKPAAEPAAPTVIEPSNDAIVAKATELAKAAGAGKPWSDFVSAAREELLKAAPAAVAKPETPASDPAATPPDDSVEEQVWMHKRLPGKTFKLKAELRKALVDQDAADAVAKATAPVRDQLKAISETLAKRDAPAAEPPAKAIEAPAAAQRTPEQLAELIKKGEAMPDGSLPIVDEEDLRKALESKPGRRARRHIMKRAKAIDLMDVIPADWWAIPGDVLQKLQKIDTPELKKAATLSSVSNLLYILSSLESAEEALESSSTVNGSYPYYYTSDGTRIDVPKNMTDRFGSLVVEMGDCVAELLDAVLAAMREEEAGEAAAKAAPVLDLMKVGARHSKADQSLVDKIHSHAVGLGAACDSGKADKAAPTDDLSKRFDAERDAFTKAIGDISGQLGDIAKRLKSIEDQPLPVGHSTARVVEKKDDSRSEAALEQTADQLLQNPELLKTLSDAAVRAAHRAPMYALPGVGSAR